MRGTSPVWPPELMDVGVLVDPSVFPGDRSGPWDIPSLLRGSSPPALGEARHYWALSQMGTPCPPAVPGWPLKGSSRSRVRLVMADTLTGRGLGEGT